MIVGEEVHAETRGGREAARLAVEAQKAKNEIDFYGAGASSKITQVVPVVMTQAAPVQNTWYTVLSATSNVVLNFIAFDVAVANETIEVEIIYDGVTQVVSFAATAATYYMIVLCPSWVAGKFATSTFSISGIVQLNMGSLAVRIRKTTAAGAGNLRCKVDYGLQ